jgi:RNA polymerase sigma-70 factor (ECF subfamily)
MKADIQLVQEVIDGNRASFAELVERHERALLRLSYRFTKDQSQAEDVVQESFIKAYQKIKTFEGRSSFKSWLFQITVNTAKNRLRSRDYDMVNIDDVNLGVDADAETGMIQADVAEMIRTEVELLPERQKLALKLRIFEDLSFKEIAEIMACPYDTAKANYRHALIKLRERMEGNRSLREWNEVKQFFLTEGSSAAAAEMEQ